MRALILSAVAALSLVTTPAFSQEDRPRAEVAQGFALGERIGSIEVFRGLPFAADTGGNNRWRAPEPALPWQGDRDASAFGPICTQRVGVSSPALRARAQSEDCLSLNIWKPADADGAPVMVWIHGGANSFGSGSDVYYDGTPFARRGVVLVTINYRVGHLGFFAHPALAESGGNLVNYGLLDQIAALRWVQQNIGAFGGDPTDVTVFGESAGGAAVLNLLASPDARGLFAKAAVQSGGGLRLPRDVAAVTREGRATVQALDLTGDAATAEALRALPADRFTQDGVRPAVPGFGPAVGGAALPEAPLVAIRGGRAAAVPLIIGVNSNEASLMQSYGMQPDAVITQFGGRLPALLDAYGPAINGDDALYARRLYGDVVFAYPARAVAIAHSRRAPVWLYWFDYVAEGRRGEVTGVAHAAEIPYVFDTSREAAGLPPVSAADQVYASGVNACFTSLALTGRPTDAPLCAGWTPYDRDRDNWFVFAPTPTEIEGRDRRPLDAIGAALCRLNLD
ncbi:carboxylesterase/lipase family protein [Brevundimonas variabilis]|uniref:Carboxylic ester hydrolase n=1 Tax=Brevundimonas variabilis TaxID=74312 RepID=A0A7W9FEQ7_9CAUL|nr:carboxylesterase family protein [Brevundimonas variabilis]MBB5746607.1 para-nitrobenzyl esterase [Brevundimonas variabilis]